MRYSINRTCRSCGRAFEELSPHNFSYNSPLGWCPTCEGLGTQQGTDIESIVVRPTKSLLDGAVTRLRRLGKNSAQGILLSVVAEQIGFDINEPWQDLTTEQQNAVLYGLPGKWIDGSAIAAGVRFEWKGLFPAIEEASRISWHYRKRLEDMTQEVPCRHCKASRLRPDAGAVRLADRTIGEVSAMSLADASRFFRNLKLPRHQKRIGGELLREINNRLTFLLDVGLDYLTLGRSGPTLSGGEAQRIRLACQLGSGLTGVLYVLDEPTIGLHPIDNSRLLAALRHLRDLGNTLLLVEHDREVIGAADHVLDFGPGAGRAGGRIVGQWDNGQRPGTSGQRKKGNRRSREDSQPDTDNSESLTAQYLANSQAIAVPTNRRPVTPYNPDTDQDWLIVRGARRNNLKNIDIAFPLSRFVAVTGVSGSGKSSLITETLWPALARRLQGAKTTPGEHDTIDGLKLIDKVISVDQSPIGQTPMSNAATYTGLFDEVRKLFARLPGSKMRGFKPGRFSFNRPGGRCEDCEGMGSKCVQMHFLPDVWITCDTCGGKRFNAATLEVTFHGKNINDVLDMSVAEAASLFADVPKLRRILQTLLDVGLDYLPLGQSGTTLSGGEAQRIKLAAELARPQTGRTLYILDEPTTGLHFDDIRKLLLVVHRLVDQGNTAICIEHNLDLIKQADWVIDLGPGPADKGGEIVVEGTPETVARCKASLTGKVLKPILDAGPDSEREPFDPNKAARQALGKSGRTRSQPDKPARNPRISPGKTRTRRNKFDDDEITDEDLRDAEEPNAAATVATEPKDRRTWHLAGKAIESGRKPKWSATVLLGLCGLLTKHVPGINFEWTHKTGATLRSQTGQRLARIITNKPEAIELWLFAPAGTFNKDDVHPIGAGGRIHSATGNTLHLRLKLINEAHLTNGTTDLIKRWAKATLGTNDASAREDSRETAEYAEDYEE